MIPLCYVVILYSQAHWLGHRVTLSRHRVTQSLFVVKRCVSVVKRCDTLFAGSLVGSQSLWFHAIEAYRLSAEAGRSDFA